MNEFDANPIVEERAITKKKDRTVESVEKIKKMTFIRTITNQRAEAGCNRGVVQNSKNLWKYGARKDMTGTKYCKFVQGINSACRC